ncbi:prolyl oligopeptidase family serine peptidase [Isoptericola sp. F-RaC21]|uniref:S9 family peptidase n=1 Tax=Isoptericola sp. F-RaC21 TaxID=3141452 RepID=UPI00315B7B7A
MTQDDDASTPFDDLDRYLELPRVGGLALSPDGSRLVTTVQTLDAKRTGWTTAVWEVDPTGTAPARRLTRSRKGESSAVFSASGDVLFTSARPDPEAEKDDDEPKAALWLLPAGGGEARVVATAPGGIGGVLAARAADVVSVSAPVLPGAAGLAEDEALRKERTDRKVSAILHAGYPVRHWDHDLGPDEERRFAGSLGDGDRLDLRPLTGPGRQLDEHQADLTPDGGTLVTTWEVADPGAARRVTLVAVDTVTGQRRVLVDDPDADVFGPAVSPDGRWVAFGSETVTTPEQAPVVRLGLVPLDGVDADPEILADDWDRWPNTVAWLPDGSGLVVTADEDGRGPVFLLTFGDGGPGAGEPVVVERVTSDDAMFTDVRVAPDGSALYALRSSYTAPPEPVRIDLAAFEATGPAGGRTPVAADALRGPVPAPALPGTLTEVETTAADGARVRAWLALPEGTSADAPAPLLLWIHGGPLSSWNVWSWRWNPWLMVARGYAVLLPDPALSTGYGQEFVQRGWGAWGAAPFTDLMAITDAVEARPEIDATRTAAMGGSFGGYMANWVAGHTDRFRAIVTHASLWALDQFGPTTDHAYYWAREMTPEMAEANSPHRSVADIRTPMLVVHGDKDYRVPVGEGLRLWRELLTASGLPADDDGATVHRFLYFPDENHWVLAPQHAKVWYQVVLAFLGEHVLDADPELPAYL